MNHTGRIAGLLAAAVLAAAGPLGAASGPATAPAPRGEPATRAAPAAPTTQATPATQPARAAIAIGVTTEEGRKLLQATVTVQGKPVENATVAFLVKRSFGNLWLGKDTTLDDGTAAIPFPVGLPGGSGGELQVIAQVTAPEKYASAAAQVTLGGGAAPQASNDPYPRALWSPRAPLGVIAAILILLAGVWFTYAYVVVQLIRIRHGESR